MVNAPDSRTPLRPVFIEALLHQGETLPETIIDFDRWSLENVFVVAMNGAIEVVENNEDDHSRNETAEDPSPHLQVMTIASTEEELQLVLANFPEGNSGILKIPCAQLLEIYAPDDLLTAILPDIALFDDRTLKFFSGLEAADKIMRVATFAARDITPGDLEL